MTNCPGKLVLVEGIISACCIACGMLDLLC